MSPTQDIFALVLARPATTAAGEHPHLVHLWWRLKDGTIGQRWLVQVYVDGALTAVSQDPMQREMWLVCDRGRGHRFELVGIQAGDSGIADELWTPHPELLNSWDPPVIGEISARLLRDERLPVDTHIAVALDGVEMDRAPLWPADENRDGFGGLFGLGWFGQNTPTTPGLGVGELGAGGLGADASLWNWRRAGLAAGDHVLELTAAGPDGLTVALTTMVSNIQTQELPHPAEFFRMEPNFELVWS